MRSFPYSHSEGPLKGISVNVMTSLAVRSVIPVVAMAIGLVVPVWPAAAQQAVAPIPEATTAPEADTGLQGDGANLFGNHPVPTEAASPVEDAPAVAEESTPPVEDAPAVAEEATPSVDDAPAAAAAAPDHTLEAVQQLIAPSAVDLAPAISAYIAANPGVGEDARRRMAAVSHFYRARDEQPLWIVGDHFSDKARAAIARIAAAAEDGLNPSVFALPDAGFHVGHDAAEAAANEVGLSLAAVTFAEEASGGRIKPTSIYKDITRTPERIDGVTALHALATASDVATALDGFNPPNVAFKRLKAKLAELRASKKEPAREPVELARTLKAGMSDDGVPALRRRLGLPEASDPENALLYDDALVEAVKSFQSDHSLNPDGIVGANTLLTLNRDSGDLIGDIVANMEMWRWMPRDLSKDYVFVNVPEFMVRVYRNGAKVHEARVVVGQTNHQTPIFSGEMQYLMVNPFWNVPESIKIKEMLPAIQADPAGYFARHGYQATWGGRVIDPSRIIWDENAVKAVGIRQIPGEANALGNIKFMFPNKHAVYLHDTPSRSLFSRTVRTFSHGCVRVDDPMSFAAAVLEGDPNWTVPKLEAMFGGPETRVDIATHLKVHIAYFTVRVDDNGELRVFNDIYGYVKSIKAEFSRSDI